MNCEVVLFASAALCCRQVVSTSRTPGHTKHFQTIFLTQNVRLCDSPGLVFPSLVDKQLQVQYTFLMVCYCAVESLVLSDIWQFGYRYGMKHVHI